MCRYHVEKSNFDFIQFFRLRRKNKKKKLKKNYHVNKIQFNKTYYN